MSPSSDKTQHNQSGHEISIVVFLGSYILRFPTFLRRIYGFTIISLKLFLISHIHSKLYNGHLSIITYYLRFYGNKAISQIMNLGPAFGCIQSGLEYIYTTHSYNHRFAGANAQIIIGRYMVFSILTQVQHYFPIINERSAIIY